MKKINKFLHDPYEVKIFLNDVNPQEWEKEERIYYDDGAN